MGEFGRQTPYPNENSGYYLQFLLLQHAWSDLEVLVFLSCFQAFRSIFFIQNKRKFEYERVNQILKNWCHFKAYNMRFRSVEDGFSTYASTVIDMAFKFCPPVFYVLLANER